MCRQTVMVQNAPGNLKTWKRKQNKVQELGRENKNRIQELGRENKYRIQELGRENKNRIKEMRGVFTERL